MSSTEIESLVARAPKARGSAGKRRPKPDDIPKIIEAISEGTSLRRACRELGIHPGHTEKMIADDPELTKLYEVARESRADGFAEDVVSIASGVLAGKVKPDAGRVAIDALKWAAGQMAPKKWGRQAQQVELTGKDGNELPPSQVTIFALPDNGRG